MLLYGLEPALNGTLTDWLIEDGWSKHHAYDLADRYRFGKDLLERYDS